MPLRLVSLELEARLLLFKFLVNYIVFFSFLNSAVLCFMSNTNHLFGRAGGLI